MKTALGLALAVSAACTVPAVAAPAHQGYLGVDVRDVSPEEVLQLKLKDTHGAEIVLVDHD
ncbi:MAG TPA: hypothetical protein VGU23_09120, partial [Acidobacteriaceae bacterium]|nr:hypothetical protein [Acidobacteriaceae bacterium]